MNHPYILLGTSSFTATGCQSAFYPKGLRPAEYLSYYAQHFDTVEVDSTFYTTPNVSVVRSWDAKTPKGLLFAASATGDNAREIERIQSNFGPIKRQDKQPFGS